MTQIIPLTSRLNCADHRPSEQIRVQTTLVFGIETSDDTHENRYLNIAISTTLVSVLI